MRVQMKVWGNVQGVGFRFFASRYAMELRLQGYAKNEDDGSVFLEVQGEEAAVKNFIAWAEKGPPSADVRGVETREIKEGGTFDGFTIY